MSTLATADLQTAVIKRLRETLRITGAATIADAVSSTQAHPYVVASDFVESPDRTFGQDGQVITFAVRVYTRDGSTTKSGRGAAGTAAGLAIATAIVEELTDLVDPLDIPGHDVVDVDYLTCTTGDESDGITRRTELLLSATIEDAA